MARKSHCKTGTLCATQASQRIRKRIEGSPTRFEPLFPSEASVNSVLGLAHDLVQDRTVTFNRIKEMRQAGTLVPAHWQLIPLGSCQNVIQRPVDVIIATPDLSLTQDSIAHQLVEVLCGSQTRDSKIVLDEFDLGVGVTE